MDGLVTDHALGTLVETERCRPVLETELVVAPDGLGLLRVGHTNTRTAANGLPIGCALELELVEHGVERLDEVSDVLGRVPRSGRDAETFLPTPDGGVVNRLDVDLVLGQ